MTILPEPASRPWFNMRAMFVLVPGLSDGYQLRISRMRAVNSMSASGSFEGREAISREPHRSRNPRLPCREAGWLTALGRREGTAGWVGAPAASARSPAVPSGNGDGVRLDLDQHRRVDQRLHLDHGGGRRARGEELAVGAAELLPAGNVGDEHARAHDAGSIGAELAQRTFDQFQAPAGLRVGVSGRVHALSRFVHRSRAGHVDVLAGAHRPAVADDRFPPGFGEDALELHRITSSTGPPRRRARRSSPGCGTRRSARGGRRAPRRARAASPASSPASPWRATRPAARVRRARRPVPDPAPGASTPAWASARRAADRGRPRPPGLPRDRGAAGRREAGPTVPPRAPGPRPRPRAPRFPSGPEAAASPRRWTRATVRARR